MPVLSSARDRRSPDQMANEFQSAFQLRTSYFKALGQFSADTIRDVIEPTQQVGVDAAISRPSARIRSIQRWSVALLVAGGALNYVDRATLSVANKLIQDDLGISVAKMGLLLSAFLWAYAFAQLPVGGLIDRFGPRRLLGLGLFCWSAAQAAGGLVRSFGMFVVARLALGVGEAPLFPGGARVVRDWFGLRERGFATGLLQSASSLGNFIAVPLLTFLMLSLNWRWMFIIVGAAGVLLAIVWWIVHRDPSEIDLTADEVRYLTEGDENTTSRPPSFAEWRKLFAHRTTWGMIAGFFGTIYTLWLYTSWLPYYLEHERHMSVARVGVVAAVPYFFGCVGAVFGGWLCDFLTRRGWTPMGGRKLLISCALLGISLCTVGTVLGAIECDRPDSDFRLAVPDLHFEQRRMGYGADCSAHPIHGVFGLYAELRRLSWRRACPNRDWIYRAAHGQLLASADVECRSEPMFGSGLPVTCRPADPCR